MTVSFKVIICISLQTSKESRRFICFFKYFFLEIPTRLTLNLMNFLQVIDLKRYKNYPSFMNCLHQKFYFNHLNSLNVQRSHTNTYIFVILETTYNIHYDIEFLFQNMLYTNNWMAKLLVKWHDGQMFLWSWSIRIFLFDFWMGSCIYVYTYLSIYTHSTSLA